jgi:hypothetical protein
MAAPVNNTDWIEWVSTLMGGVSRETHTATLPPDRFHCLLDELPLHLVPRRYLDSLISSKNSQQQLFLNPSCEFTQGGKLPDDLASHPELFSRFAMQGNIAWVRNDTTGATLPFWLGPGFQAILENLKPGEPVSTSLPNDVSSILLAVGILKLANAPEVEHRQWKKTIEPPTALFREKGYVPISGLIHPFHIAALRRYYRYLIRKGEISLGDGQSPRRYVAYNDPVARFFHWQITTTLSAVAGETVQPSYVYLASYLSGAELKKHTDREQCEFSITLCLDFSPEPAIATPWPVKLDTSTGTVTVYQALGDGLAYRGTRLPHYRDVLPEGQTSTSIFFHYVAADFKGSLA